MDPRITQLSDELFFIERGWLNANHLVFTGKPRTLIDTGYIRDVAETESLIAQCGLSIEDVELIVNTHTHCDHIGGNAEFQRRSGCKVALHLVDRYFIDQRNDWATWWGYYQQEAEFFPTDYSLTDGEVLTLGEMNWLVLHTPGHAMGQIALHCLDTGWLVSADTLWDGDFGVLTPRIEGLDAPFRLRESLERLSRLKVQKILPGHGPIIDDAPAAIRGLPGQGGGLHRGPQAHGLGPGAQDNALRAAHARTPAPRGVVADAHHLALVPRDGGHVFWRKDESHFPGVP